jgi:NADPH-dependent 2,4-dienoyl-CoA reductase/sulfur reductase-like enzyme
MSLKCVVNPELSREQEWAMVAAPQPRRVLVVGGGPAGMEAARVAASRGHVVILCEAQPELGGQFRLAAIPPQKQEIVPALKYFARSLEEANVKVILGRNADRSLVEQLKPDVLVVATGGMPTIPETPGIEGERVVTAWDVLSGKAAIGRKVVVVGGGTVGCETAEFIAEYGREVVIIEMLPELGSDAVPGHRDLLLQRLHDLDVNTVTSAALELITADGLVARRDEEEVIMSGVDTIVIAMGVKPVNSLADEVRDLVSEIHVIGDAATPATALEAFAAGAELGREI